ncbi:amidohydrolase family protein [Tropicibacter sp. R16_0]|uniref:amidohydrolase family protein n=1 Tax=Tropicibacter sp. R16_0 TaxID=2821102 RepID=UPI001ADBF8FA|nr:amidohydrolase family protein [Tropicibacter sp. R16_0]MBO9453040.1 amidohydrolase family protein [Tropicibacter sp. R16_0]
MTIKVKTALASVALAASVVMSSAAFAQQEETRILFTNVEVFDGRNPELIKNANVLVVGNLIAEVSDEPLAVANAEIIDGGGRTLMPGLIESHVHLNLQHMVGGYDTIESRDWQEIGAMAAYAAQSLLMDGFTTVRDPGATQDGIKRAIDRGDAIGPRIYASGAVISQTSGHGDFRLRGQTRLDDRYTFKAATLGMTHIVDGYDATLSAARQNLANGAVFNKMMLSGGVFSSKDPLHTVQGTDDEVRAVVEASAAWGTYATAHVNNPSDIQRGLRLGLGEIMHGQFLDEETAAMMEEAGVFYNPQLSVSSLEAIERTFGPEPSVNKSKSLQVAEGMARIPDILLKFPKLMEKTTFGVDTVTVTPANAMRNRDHEIWFWADKFGNLQTLKSMTSIGGDLAALTGLLNPYPAGPIGVIQEGAYADILLIDGNPLEDITLIGGSEALFEAPDRKPGDIPAMDLIMKDGVIYKNTLE